MTATVQKSAPEFEDALAYLPYKGVVEYRRNQVIYDEQNPSIGLSLVIRGRVKVTTSTEDGSPVVVGLFGADEFFGVRTLLGDHMTSREQTTALEITTLMVWPRAEIEAHIEREPRLGVALIQLLTMRCLDLEERLESLATANTQERLAVTLIRLAKSAPRGSDGVVTIPSLTHQVLSEYVGTSREIVSTHMSQWRRKGLVRYSRDVIQLYPEALSEHLRSPHV